ncbi:hypothetical protein JOB18_009544 [Solea senegalensis]|uniref:Uncharacterized protein n=1 Tax=Solea senegalensis TaxID=28829 RepID=A0AAV6PYX0_SOLSE|nr:hypothetical protein JOB18_009544 [Solea senegalensis]
MDPAFFYSENLFSIAPHPPPLPLQHRTDDNVLNRESMFLSPLSHHCLTTSVLPQTRSVTGGLLPCPEAVVVVFVLTSLHQTDAECPPNGNSTCQRHTGSVHRDQMTVRKGDRNCSFHSSFFIFISDGEG